ncbi:hypothetical protein J3R03_008051 [Actinoplanes couchii]|nr:hypothetical protein [Actinoplanes couchii]
MPHAGPALLVPVRQTPRGCGVAPLSQTPQGCGVAPLSQTPRSCVMAPAVLDGFRTEATYSAAGRDISMHSDVTGERPLSGRRRPPPGPRLVPTRSATPDLVDRQRPCPPRPPRRRPWPRHVSGASGLPAACLSAAATHSPEIVDGLPGNVLPQPSGGDVTGDHPRTVGGQVFGRRPRAVDERVPDRHPRASAGQMSGRRAPGRNPRAVGERWLGRRAPAAGVWMIRLPSAVVGGWVSRRFPLGVGGSVMGCLLRGM